MHDDHADQQAPEDAAVAGQPPGKPRILCPGTQYLMGGESHIEDLLVGNDEFTKQVVQALADTKEVYRHHGVAGVVRADEFGTTFEPLTKEFVRGLIDKHVTLVKTKVVKSEEGLTIQERAVAAGPDHGGLVLDRLGRDDRIHLIRYLCEWPTYGLGWVPIKPGYNAGGYYYAEPPELATVSEYDGKRTLPLERIHQHFDDLLHDFPFATPADKENLIGLLLTFMTRPAMARNVPFFLAGATRERTGKSKLLVEIVGGTIFGAPLITAKYDEEEVELHKTITSVLASGRPYCLFDNVDKELGGSALCAALTSRNHAARILGSTNWTMMENNLVFMGTANNATLAKDMNGRVCQINLVPLDSQPERRTGFRHPDAFAFAQEKRAKTLLLMRVMVERWRNLGCPPHPAFTMGSFEAWAAQVGGIMHANGYTAWMTNWCFQSSDLDAKLAELMETWWKAAQGSAGREARYRFNGSSTTVTPKELMDIGKNTEYIAEIGEKPLLERAKIVSLGKRLQRILGRPVRTKDSGELLIEVVIRHPTLYRLRRAAVHGSGATADGPEALGAGTDQAGAGTPGAA